MSQTADAKVVQELEKYKTPRNFGVWFKICMFWFFF